MTTNTAPRFSPSPFNAKVTTDFYGFTDYASSAVLQPDGKLVVSGYSYHAGDTNSDFGLARYNPDGSLDSSFGNGGKVTTDFVGLNDNLQSVALQSDGKLVAVGYTLNASGNYDFALARYNPDGSLDNSFDGDGKLIASFGSWNDYAMSVVIQPDGKLVIAGYSQNNKGSYNHSRYTDFVLARYNPDGSLDNSFSGDGKLTMDFNSMPFNSPYSVALQTDGKMVVAGYGGYYWASFGLARFNADGSLDSSFGNGGTLTTDIYSNYNIATSLAIQPDGKLVLAGTNGGGAASDSVLVRYNTDGSLDNSFDGDGKLTIDFSPTGDGFSSVKIQPDGKIMVVGNGGTPNSDFTLARYNPDGSLDNSFGNGGKLTTDLGGIDGATSVIIQPDSSLLVSGQSNASGNYDFVLARYNADGSAGNPYYLEDGGAIALNLPQVSDTELDVLNDYSGASLTLMRQGGANAQDGFSISGGFTIYDNFLVMNNNAIATFTNSGGQLMVNFINTATTTLVNALLGSISYQNTAASLPSLVTLNLSFSDGVLSSSYPITVNTVNVNDAPVGHDKTISTNVNSAYTFSVADFGFSDSNDTPANHFNNLIISQLPSAGSLTLFGNAVSLNQSISVANLNLGVLKFTPTLNGTSNGYAKIGFKVQDDGGTAYNGVNTDGFSRVLTINVDANTNHLPTGSVTITGNAINGQVLTASNNLQDTDGLGAITYTWQANNITIGTGNTYQLTSNEIGKTITAIANYTDLLGTDEHVNSNTTATVIDAVAAGVTISGSDFSTNEQGDNAVFSVKLNTAPLHDVVITFTASDTTEGVITNPILTFTATNWSIPQNLIITGQNDTSVDGNVAYSINGAINTIDVIYKNISVNSFNLINQDTPVIPTETINGSNGTDILQGTDAPSYILGMAGDDDLSGGGGNDTIYGSYGADVISGNDGNDALYGEQDADYLDGGAGNDTLDGGLGLDTLSGGAGNDTYYLGYDAVDVINDNGLSTDIDTVIMPYNLSKYTLANTIENATISAGTQASGLTGNNSNNSLTGNDGKNTLNGSIGRDSLFGGKGNDVLDGGTGNDQLTGGVGKDIFKFDAAITSANSDTITDFKVVDDTIQLKNTIFKALTVKGVLSPDNFVTATAAVDNNDYVIYNKANGAVLYDADGNGAIASVLVTMIGANLGVTNTDFVVV